MDNLAYKKRNSQISFTESTGPEKKTPNYRFMIITQSHLEHTHQEDEEFDQDVRPHQLSIDHIAYLAHLTEPQQTAKDAEHVKV